MSQFGDLKTEGMEETQDRLGGSFLHESDIYTGKVKMAYAGKSDGGARNVTVIVGFGPKEYRETVYITNKKGENFFLNPQDKTKKVPLPGFTTIDDICLCITGESLADQETEEKMVNIYDFDLKKEVPKSVHVLTALTGQEIALGIIKQLENKRVQQGADWVPSPETQEKNTIDKVFHPEHKLTVVEARNGNDTPAFWNAWLEKNKGVTRDKRTIKDGGAGGNSGRPGSKPGSGAPQAAGSTGSTQPPKKSLFGKS